eukprot:TRINITY_DN117_c0_g2_i2.p1 TRINITY_DN117_c0_g2~~TRINITY_DN117_c0_g2_i2.p1  ORF type:complete len:222 (-),score=70.05 TRINITY_DN117_c0_g2_i2:291-956(-)
MPPKKLRTFFPKSKIKQMMQKDEDVGKISADVPLMISRGLELFLKDLLDRTHHVANSRGAKTLLPQHLKACILGSAKFDFLSHVVEGVADLPPESEAPKKRSGGGAAGGGARKRKAAASSSNVDIDDSKFTPTSKKPRPSKKKAAVEDVAEEHTIAEQRQVPPPTAVAASSSSSSSSSSSAAFSALAAAAEIAHSAVNSAPLPTFSGAQNVNDDENWNDDE